MSRRRNKNRRRAIPMPSPAEDPRFVAWSQTPEGMEAVWWCHQRIAARDDGPEPDRFDIPTQ